MMMKVLKHLIGSSRFSESLRTDLLSSSPLIFEEDLSGSYISREPSEYTLNPTRGAIAVTSSRLVVWAMDAKKIDVPLEPKWLKGLTVVCDKVDRVSFTIDLGYYQKGKTGTLEVRLETEQAQRIVNLVNNAISKEEVAKGLVPMSEGDEIPNSEKPPAYES